MKRKLTRAYLDSLIRTVPGVRYSPHQDRPQLTTARIPHQRKGRRGQ